MTQVDKTGGEITPLEPEPTSRYGRRKQKKAGGRSSVFDLLGKSNDPFWEEDAGEGGVKSLVVPPAPDEVGEAGGPDAPHEDAAQPEAAHPEAAATAQADAAEEDAVQAQSTEAQSKEAQSTEAQSTEAQAADPVPTPVRRDLTDVTPGRSRFRVDPAKVASTAGGDAAVAGAAVATASVADEVSDKVAGKGETEAAEPEAAEVVDGGAATAPEAAKVADPEVGDSKVAEPDEATPEVGPDEEATPEAGRDEATPGPTNLDRTGWEVVREGIHQTGHGTGLVARSIWTRMRNKLPGAQSSRGLAAWLVAALVVVVALIVVATNVLQGAPTVVVSTAGPATINAQPGGVGTTSTAQNLSFSVGLNVVGVSSPVTVTGVKVINGSQVTKGQALLSLDPAPLKQNVASIQSDLTAAQLALTAAEAAVGGNHTPGELYSVTSLQGQVTFDQQLLTIAEGNSTAINAPISGSVTNLAVQPGQVVRPGTTMLQIVDTSRINVTAGLQLSDMQGVAVGQKADVVPTGLVGVHLPGTVIAINPTATGGGLQGSVVIAADNVASNPLPIGTQVFVRISATRHAAVSVPAIAVQNLDLAPAVFVVSNGHVHVVPVTVGAVDANRAQILSGLRAGQVVAESNTQLLTNGERVNIGR